MTQFELSTNRWVMAAIAAVAAVVFVSTSLLKAKKQHRDVEAWHVHAGAAICGAIFGAVIGFAYRRALLRKSIETAQSHLAKMTPATAVE